MSGTDPALLAGCQQFEAVMLRPLLERLHLASVTPLAAGDQADTDGHAAADLMGSLFADALSLALVRAGGFGLARALVHALSGDSK